MANHRKRRPQKAAGHGCPMCKPHKRAGNAKWRRPASDRRRLQDRG